MGRIFGEAKEVLAWLGEEGSRSFETLKTPDGIRVGGAIPSRNDAFWGEINDFAGRPWFQRVWIAQELVLPRRVLLMCGRRSQMSWENFLDGLRISGERYHVAYTASAASDVKLLRDAGAAYALGPGARGAQESGRGALRTIQVARALLPHQGKP